jgi:prevent-host-death family protein
VSPPFVRLNPNTNFRENNHVNLHVKMLSYRQEVIDMLAKNLDLRPAINHMISVSDLGRGQASRVIQAVEKNKEQYIVVKNNKPQAILISIEEYLNLMESKEELELLLIASERTKTPQEYIDFNTVLNEFNISHEDLDEIESDVEIE